MSAEYNGGFGFVKETWIGVALRDAKQPQCPIGHEFGDKYLAI
jgi:hypothetical protein